MAGLRGKMGRVAGIAKRTSYGTAIVRLQTHGTRPGSVKPRIVCILTNAVLSIAAIPFQGKLARTGHHRVAIPDLIIAAAAEAAGLKVLHYDRDFDIIASVTGQPVEWIAPRGSL